MYRKFYSYNDMPIVKKPAPPQEQKNETTLTRNQDKGILQNLKNDDLILLAVFFILIMNNCEDRLLLLAIAFIFFSDYFDT